MIADSFRKALLQTLWLLHFITSRFRLIPEVLRRLHTELCGEDGRKSQTQDLSDVTGGYGYGRRVRHGLERK